MTDHVSRKTYRLLIADDESHIVNILQMKLARAGYDVRVARDGQQAFEMAQDDPPDLLITDYQMPRLTGLELCQQLAQQPRTAGVPILMLTARGFSIAADQFASTRVVDVLSKPFSPNEIFTRVARLLGGAAQSAA